MGTALIDGAFGARVAASDGYPPMAWRCSDLRSVLREARGGCGVRVPPTPPAVSNERFVDWTIGVRTVFFWDPN